MALRAQMALSQRVFLHAALFRTLVAGAAWRSGVSPSAAIRVPDASLLDVYSVGDDEIPAQVAGMAKAPRPPEGNQEDAFAPSTAEAIKHVWGSAKWPLDGQEKRPSVPEAGASAPTPWEAYMAGLVIILGVLGLSVSLTLPITQVLLQPRKEWKFYLHLHALSSAILWRHTHTRALWMHLARVAIPALFLYVMYNMQHTLAEQVGTVDSELLAMVGGPKGIVEAVLEFTLAVSMVYVVMSSMVFFVWHVGAESESGFRHLVHVSGLSRSAYILATAGIDGLLLSVLGVLVMLLVAGGAIAVRMVLWSSPILLLLLVLILCTSAVATGYILHFLMPSARLASIVAQVVTVVVVFTAPFSVLSNVVPSVGQQAWRVILFPTMSGFRAIFALVAACSKGRCLELSDVGQALLKGNWVGPFRMVIGAPTSPEMAPPEALISFLFLVATQLVLLAGAVVLLDRHHNPPLHDSGVHATRASQSNTEVALEVKGLVHWYGWLQSVRSEPKEKVLGGVGFAVNPGETLGMLGPNGAGKTTVIRCITGEERPMQGTVAVNAQVAGGTHIGLCPQDTVVNSDLNVVENLLFFTRVRGVCGSEGMKYVEEMLSVMQLGQKRDSLPGTLSGGQRRRLAIGCAMVANPAVVILDEPTTGLDPVNRRSIWGTISNIRNAGGCCLLTTHMLEEAEELCSSIVIMAKGKVVASGTVPELKETFGTGYVLSVDCRGKEDDAKAFLKGLLAEEDQVPVRSKAEGQLTFRFTRDEEALGNSIIAIARGKGSHGIKHWGISQASLEDAYVRIITEDAAEAEAAEP